MQQHQPIFFRITWIGRKMSNKFLKTIFAGLIIIAVAIIIFIFLAVIFYVPDITSGVYGEADANLDHSLRLIYSLYLLFNRYHLIQAGGLIDEGRIFIIDFGESASAISEKLVSEGLIPDARAFNIYLKYKGIDRKLQSGIYFLSPANTPIEIADIIHDTDPESVRFSFLAGWRVEEIAALIPSSGFHFSSENFLEIIFSSYDKILNGLPLHANNLEGLLFPTSHTFLRSSSAESVIKEMAGTFFHQLPADYEEKVRENGLSLYDAIILASIIQKEAVIMDEAHLIASVFINRLSIDMPLQSDPTVQYALGFIESQQSWWKNPLSSQDLMIDSPFNTYINNGLPPTPICNPGQEALLAVAYPAITDYYYFRSACDGSGLHTFSRTYEEHLAAACK